VLILIVAQGPDKGRIYEWLDNQTVIVGRESKDLRLSDDKASRQHARFKCEGGQWYVRDLASRHGTFVNKIRTDGKTPLADGDRVQIGRTQLVVARVPAEQAERAALLGNQPSSADAWSEIPTYRRHLPRASTAAAMAAAAFAIGCSAWLYTQTRDANRQLHNDLVNSQTDATLAQLEVLETQRKATQTQVAMADRTEEILTEVQTLGSTSKPALNEILALVQTQAGNAEALGDLRTALANLRDTSEPTLDAILTHVDTQSQQWQALAQVRDVVIQQQADTADLLPQLQALAMTTRSNERALAGLNTRIEQVQAKPDLDAQMLDQLEAVAAELKAQPTMDQIAAGVRSALASEQVKTQDLLKRIENQLAMDPQSAKLIGPLREALAKQADRTEQLVAQAFERKDATAEQVAELQTLMHSQTGETAAALRGVIEEIDLVAELAAVQQIEQGAGDQKTTALLEELMAKLEATPTPEQLADAVTNAVTSQLDGTRPLLEQIANAIDQSHDQDASQRKLMEQVSLALQAQEEADARLDQIYDLLASGETENSDSEALRRVLREIRSKSIAGMDELRSTLRREVQAAFVQQRMAMSNGIDPEQIETYNGYALASPQPQETVGVSSDKTKDAPTLTDVEQAYRLAFQTGKPITIGGGSMDPKTGKASRGRVIDPVSAKSAGINNWRDWYLMDDFAERMRLQRQAVQYHDGRRGRSDIVGIPQDAID